jgi:hypothetical protein
MIAERLTLMAAFLVLVGCASWQAPPVDTGTFRERATHISREGVDVRALVLTRDESLQLLGADVFDHDIEPVWIEVRNRTSDPLILMQTGADPDYFSPLEVSWLLHRPFAGADNEAMDLHIQSVSFSRDTIEPGETRSGVIFTNPHFATKLLNIDIFGRFRLIPFTFFLPIPDEDGVVPPTRAWPFSPDELTDYASERDFKRALQQYLCCKAQIMADDRQLPLSVVWVGRPEDIGGALVRRGYRLSGSSPVSAQQLGGRDPDYEIVKTGQGGAPENWIRMWVLPYTYEGRPVLVAQTAAPRGGRFASGIATPSIDPAFDHARDLLVQDMLYSGGLAKLAVLSTDQPAAGSDGKVAVLFFAARQVDLDEVILSDWEGADSHSEPAPYRPGKEQ